MVSTAVFRLYRLVLLLYPAEFRRRYRDDMVQLLLDRQLHDQRRASLVLLDETFDAVRTAPRMRWESPMNRTVIIAVVGTVAIAAALVAKVMLLPLGLLALAAWFLWGRRRAADHLGVGFESLDAVDARGCARDRHRSGDSHDRWRRAERGLVGSGSGRPARRDCHGHHCHGPCGQRQGPSTRFATLTRSAPCGTSNRPYRATQ